VNGPRYFRLLNDFAKRKPNKDFGELFVVSL